MKGYDFEGPALELGALVREDGTADPAERVRIPVRMMNRHGLVAGATGTGKTKTLQLMAEQLAAQGVPVFLADVKGDLSGLASPGTPGDRIARRAADVGQDWAPEGCVTEFFSLGGVGEGIPLRATMSAFGPTLLSRVLELNETQESSLGLIFYFADTNGLPLLDLKDLIAVIRYLTETPEALSGIGGLSASTAGVILRALVNFQAQGAEAFFGEPEFDVHDLLRTTPDGRGVISILELPAVQDRPQLFSTFLMWLLADLFETLPEVGDPDKPSLVFFFDEAHLLFEDASKAFLRSITQTVRLIRSKGVGVFFVTQTPKDVPADVLAQLGARVQHALRAFTPQDAKALKATVSTFPASSYDLERLLTELGIGEAVVTVLSETGAPTPVAWTRLRAPRSLMAPSAPAVVQGIIAASPLLPKYGTAVDRQSAYEILAARLARQQEPEPQAPVGRPEGRPERAPGSRRSKRCSPRRSSGRWPAPPRPRSAGRSPGRSSARRDGGAERVSAVPVPVPGLSVGRAKVGGMGFSGFPDEALIFYEGLVADNSKAYWSAHKELYETGVRAPMLALMDELEPEFGPAHLFRPHRDVRFSKDKSPYKTHQGAYCGVGVEGVGYYVQVDADGLYVAAGWWMPGDQVLRYREALDDDTAGTLLEETLAALPGDLTVGGDRLKTRPRGTPEDHPRLELLRHKTLHAGRRFEPEPWLHTPETLDRVRSTWRALVPLVDWLRRHIS